jgi:hypothetical protein
MILRSLCVIGQMKTVEVILQLCRKTRRVLQKTVQKQTSSSGKRLSSCGRHWPRATLRSIGGEEKVKEDGEVFL